MTSSTSVKINGIFNKIQIQIHGINICFFSWVPPVYLPRYVLLGGLRGVSQGLRLKSDPGSRRGSHKDPKSHCLYIVHYCSVFLFGIVEAKHSRMGLGYTNTPFPFWHISVQYCSLALQQ